MITIDESCHVYILSLHVRTGGPQTLHQLLCGLKKRKANVSMVYMSEASILKGVEPLYALSALDIANEIDDDYKNIMIVPEVLTNILKDYKRIRKVVYWLSLDFYLQKNISNCAKIKMRIWELPTILYPIMYIYLFLKNTDKIVEDDSFFLDAFHLYNCEYIAEYLRKVGVSDEDMYYLCGPLDDAYIQQDRILEKNNSIVIAANRAKCSPILVKAVKTAIQKKRKDIIIVLLNKMSSTQVADALRFAKVYIDLGMFPGPERMPREAVALWCNILISNKGAASNSIDYPIYEEYKVNATLKNTRNIVEKAIQMLNEYEEHVHDFDRLRGKVNMQPEMFEEGIDKIFDVHF